MLVSALVPALTSAAPWKSAPSAVLEESASVTTQRLELADVDMDGDVDIIAANVVGDGDADGPVQLQPNILYLNQGDRTFIAAAGTVLNKGDGDSAYAIKAADVNQDGAPDLVVGANFASPSYVLLNTLDPSTNYDPNIDLIEVDSGMKYSVGDLELGDVDGDGNLDILATDWGTTTPYGGKNTFGNPLRLWLGDGTGAFEDSGQVLPKVPYSFDLELVDLDNDYDLDALAATLGSKNAIILINDGAGNLVDYTANVPYIGDPSKYSSAFTVMDLDKDSRPDLIALRMGAETCVNGICSARNVILTNQMDMNLLVDKNYWAMLSNPAKVDFDAATLDFNNDGSPDFLVVGEPLTNVAVNTRLLINNKAGVFKVQPDPEQNALSAVVTGARGVMFADFDSDSREDVAIAVRGGPLLNQVFFGSDMPGDDVPIDTTAPNIGPHEAYPDSLYFNQPTTIRARVHDFKTPTTWHDFRYDAAMATYNLDKADDAALQHKRRVPWVEYAFGLGPNELDMLADFPDTGPDKHIAPGVWYGESLWTIDILPTWQMGAKTSDTLTWQLCATDAADNEACVGPFQVQIETPPCGENGVKDDWEECDDPNNPLCVECVLCGNGIKADTEECDGEANCSATCTLAVCGDNKVEGTEQCDDAGNPLCVDCALLNCGNDFCDVGECNTCPGDCTAEDCPSCVTEGSNDPSCTCDGVCQPDQDCELCPGDCSENQCSPMCVTEGANEIECTCGNDICEASETPENCPADCPGGATDSEVDSACSAGADPSACGLDDDGCGCNTRSDDPKGIVASLLLLAAFGVRRRRQRA